MVSYTLIIFMLFGLVVGNEYALLKTLDISNDTVRNVTGKIDCNNGVYYYTFIVDSVNITINGSSNVTVLSNKTENEWCECNDGWTSLNETIDLIYIGNETINGTVVEHYYYHVDYCNYKQTPRWTVALMEGGAGLIGIGGSGWMCLSRGESWWQILLAIVEFLLSPFGSLVWWTPITLCLCVCLGPFALFSLTCCLFTLPIYYIMWISTVILIVSNIIQDGNNEPLYNGWDLIGAWGK